MAEQSFDRAEWWSGEIPPPVHWSHLLVDLAGCVEIMSQLHPVGYPTSDTNVEAHANRCRMILTFGMGSQDPRITGGLTSYVLSVSVVSH